MSTDLAVSRAFNFSGTDNSLVTMIDTVRLSMERLKFHLDLFLTSYNGQRYKLQNGESDFLRLDENGSFKMYSSSIQLWSGARNFKGYQLRQKRFSDEGRVVRDLEAQLSRRNLAITYTSQEINNYPSARNTLYQFYYSRRFVKHNRTYEIQKKRHLAQRCSEERRYVTYEPNHQLDDVRW
ncbi:MAG: hypothetical protein EXX96DRAFT_268323 [Benjaminiella poitrasii]|nr:MAG: hypothetical protein EXX96DRAFT_268323 [Benjaminiella poitrasii]